MSGIVMSNGGSRARRELALTARGLLTENFDLALVGGAVAVSTGVVYGHLVGLRAGDSVAKLVVGINVAAAGTDATLARFGIANSAGVMLAVSGDQKAAAGWTQGQPGFALSAPYVVPADGGYFLCLIVVGTWGSTQATLARTQPQNSYPKYGSNAPYQFQWAGQSDLPIVGNSLTMTTGAGTAYWMAAAAA